MNTADYTATPLSKISSALDAAFSSLDRPGEQTLRSASANCIVLVPSPQLLPSSEKAVEVLSQIRPGRFFVLICDDTATSITAQVATRCHVISKSERSCSDVVRLTSSPEQWTAVPSIVRANLVTGVVTELYLMESIAQRPFMLEGLSSVTDLIVVDSAMFDENLSQIQSLRTVTNSIVDLEWIAGAPWRDQLRNIFERPLVAARLPALESVAVTCASGRGEQAPAVGLLFCGWLLSRLHLDPVAIGSSGYECRGSGMVKHINFDLRIVPGAGPRSAIQEVLFTFSEPQGGTIKLSRAELLETVVNLGQHYRLTRPLEEESAISRVQRYFLIGESFKNYTESLRSGLLLESLRHGFIGARP